MKPERMRIKIAEACGITPKQIEILGMKDWIWCDKSGKPTLCKNYPESHDAMAEARKTLDNFEWSQYTWELRKLLAAGTKETPYTVNENQIINATPLQHAEAFLRAKGLWEEGE